jgi:hypothetical protein
MLEPEPLVHAGLGQPVHGIYVLVESLHSSLLNPLL